MAAPIDMAFLIPRRYERGKKGLQLKSISQGPYGHGNVLDFRVQLHILPCEQLSLEICSLEWDVCRTDYLILSVKIVASALGVWSLVR